MMWVLVQVIRTTMSEVPLGRNISRSRWCTYRMGLRKRMGQATCGHYRLGWPLPSCIPPGMSLILILEPKPFAVSTSIVVMYLERRRTQFYGISSRRRLSRTNHRQFFVSRPGLVSRGPTKWHWWNQWTRPWSHQQWLLSVWPCQIPNCLRRHFGQIDEWLHWIKSTRSCKEIAFWLAALPICDSGSFRWSLYYCLFQNQYAVRGTYTPALVNCCRAIYQLPRHCRYPQYGTSQVALLHVPSDLQPLVHCPARR